MRHANTLSRSVIAEEDDEIDEEDEYVPTSCFLYFFSNISYSIKRRYVVVSAFINTCLIPTRPTSHGYRRRHPHAVP